MEPYAAFTSLEFDRPAEGVLRITLRTPGKLNAVSGDMHRELAAVWLAVDADGNLRLAIAGREVVHRRPELYGALVEERQPASIEI